MPTGCSADLVGFAAVEGRAVVAAFDGGTMTSDAGALLLGATDRAIGLIDRFAACFSDARAPALVEHGITTLVGQRVFGLALGYEDLIDHDQLRHDPVPAALAGELAARRSDRAALAGKSTLNRLEHAPQGAPTRHHKIGPDATAIEGVVRRALSRCAGDAAEADRPRPRRGRRPAARASGRPLLPRLLRLLLLSAPRCDVRAPPARRQAAAVEHRRRRRRGRGDRPHRGADPAALAAGAHPAAGPPPASPARR
jgi:Transposase DDE domain group 1